MKFVTRSIYGGNDRAAYENAVARYESRKRAVAKDLDPGWRKLMVWDLHDARIAAIEHRSRTSVSITLDTTACPDADPDLQSLTLTFRGAAKYWIPYSVKDEWWLFHEIDLNRDGLPVLRALLQKDEIMIAGGSIETVAA